MSTGSRSTSIPSRRVREEDVVSWGATRPSRKGRRPRYPATGCNPRCPTEGKSIHTDPVVVRVENWPFPHLAGALQMASDTPTANWLRTTSKRAPSKRHGLGPSAVVVVGLPSTAVAVLGVAGKRAWISFWKAMLSPIPCRLGDVLKDDLVRATEANPGSLVHGVDERVSGRI